MLHYAHRQAANFYCVLSLIYFYLNFVTLSNKNYENVIFSRLNSSYGAK